MGDMLEDGSLWLADRLAESVSRTVGYRRGANSSTVAATIGRSSFESVNSSGVAESWESRDFIVLTSAMPYGEPQRGDIVIDEIGGVETLYQVTAPRGVPVFRWGDAFQKTVRIHTKQFDRDATILIDELGREISVPLFVD